MALHDYGCIHCGTDLLDQYRPVDEGAQANPPLCPTCGGRMTWYPAIGRMDLMSDGTSFAKFDTTDASGRPVHIDSLRKLRQVERDSETAAANGEGQQMVFRAFSQTKGNRLDGTLGDLPEAARPTATGKARFGLRGGAKPLGETAPDHAYGPGVSDANTSALND